MIDSNVIDKQIDELTAQYQQTDQQLQELSAQKLRLEGAIIQLRTMKQEIEKASQPEEQTQSKPGIANEEKGKHKKAS